MYLFHSVLISDIFRSEAMCTVCLPLLLAGHWSTAVTLTSTCAQRSWDFRLGCYSSSFFVSLSLSSQLLFCLLPRQSADILALVVLSECERTSPYIPPPLAEVPRDSGLSDWSSLCFVYSPYRVMLFFSRYSSLLCVIGDGSTS